MDDVPGFPRVFVARDGIGTIVHLPDGRVLAILAADASPDEIERWLHRQRVAEVADVMAELYRAEPRTFSMPNRPGGVTSVRDAEGNIWRLVSRRRKQIFACEGELAVWDDLLYYYGPLTEVRDGTT